MCDREKKGKKQKWGLYHPYTIDLRLLPPFEFSKKVQALSLSVHGLCNDALFDLVYAYRV